MGRWDTTSSPPFPHPISDIELWGSIGGVNYWGGVLTLRPPLPLFCFPSVFWDLYCAAPDRRETCEHSSEAKAFHDYVSAWGWDGMGGSVSW